MFACCCFKILVLKFLFFTGKNTLQSNDPCKESVTSNKYTEYIKDEGTGASILILSNFNTYKEIVLTCSFTYYFTNYSTIYLMPNTRIILDESLRIGDPFRYSNYIYLLNLRGIAFYRIKLPIHQHTRVNAQFRLMSRASFKSFISSDDNQTLPMDLSQCNEKALANMTSFMQPFMQLSCDSVLYPREGLCSFMFKQSMIKYLQFNNIYNSFLIENRLSFMNTDYSRVLTMLILEQLELTLWNEKLTSRVMNVNLFKNIKYLTINLHLFNIRII
jgi:hypothetical protein